MALADYQLSYNTLTIGDGTVFEVLQAEGIDSFDVRSSDQTLPLLWGVQAGGDFVNARSIILTVEMLNGYALHAAFETAFLPSAQATPTALQTLVWKYPDRVQVLCQCRVRRRTRVRTVSSEIGVTQWVVQLDAPDPRLYAADQSSVVAGAFIADGLAIESTTGSGGDLAFDSTTGSGGDLAVDAPGTSATGGVTVSNDGNVDTYPSFTFQTTSSISSWTVINDTTGEQATFAYALIPGHLVVADMAGVATGSTVSPVTLDGVPSYAIWQAPRVPIRLIPGLNSLRFVITAGSTAGSTATIAYRSAWL